MKTVKRQFPGEELCEQYQGKPIDPGFLRKKASHKIERYENG